MNAGRLDQSAYWAMRAWPLAPNVPLSHYYVSEPLIFLDPAVGQRWVAAGLARFKPDDPAGWRAHRPDGGCSGLAPR